MKKNALIGMVAALVLSAGGTRALAQSSCQCDGFEEVILTMEFRSVCDENPQCVWTLQ